MTLRAVFAMVLAAAALLGLAPAHAEIWGYVDAQGVAHLASDKQDERYELFFRGGESFDTSAGIATPAAPGAAGSATAAASRLLAFFQVSRGYRLAQRHLAEAAHEQGLDPELLQAVITTESGFDAAAVSPKGAIGLMQVMPATAQRYGITGDTKQPLVQKLADPRINLRTGARYLRDLIRMFPGRLELALAAYNAGEGAVQRAGNRIPNYPETKNYVHTVLQLYGLLKPAASATPTAGAPRRVRIELPAPGSLARRNMPAGMGAPVPVESAGVSSALLPQ
jgi:hypothetical protein